jgi:hypothetical protein
MREVDLFKRNYTDSDAVFEKNEGSIKDRRKDD